jgi:predicted phosphodiesterase
MLTLILPDVHLPYEDKHAIDSVLDLVAEEQPERIIQIGDLLDMKAPSRWTKGKAEEYIHSVRDEAEAGEKFWRSLREASDKAEILWLYGNHEARLRDYTVTYAPALATIVPSAAELMKTKDYRVTVVNRQPYELAPGVAAIHGKLLASQAGMSARKEMLRHNKSIVQGHSHRLGIIYETTDRTRFALEAGWLGDISAATYLDFPGLANWQAGFGYLYSDGDRVTPGVVPVHDKGRFVFNGRIYGG